MGKATSHGKHEPRPAAGDRTGSSSSRRPAPAQGFVRRARHVRHRRLRIVIATAAVLLVLLPIDIVASRGHVHSRVSVGDVPLGGDSVAEATSRLSIRAEELAATPMRFTWGDTEFATTPADLGWAPDAAATAEAAYAVGRRGAPWAWFWDRARAWVGVADVSWKQRFDRNALRAQLSSWSEGIGVPPVEGRVWIDGMEVMSETPVAGREIDQTRLLEDVTAFVNGRADPDQPLPVVTAQPITSAAGIEQARRKAATIISAPVRAEIGRASLSLSPKELAKLFETTVVEGSGDLQPTVAFSKDGVAKLLEPLSDQVERAPTSARFIGKGRQIEIKPSKPGRKIDPMIAAQRLVAIAQSPERRGKIPLVPTEAEFTTEEAQALGIKRKISSFTTYFTPGEPRTINISLGAEILDGTIVGPGEMFSLNERLGERTLQRGFVMAPAIVDGAFGEQVGGGISQLTTTAFNAIFFGGFPFDEFQAHSIYIDRYPMGREATLHWPHPDLAFTNDTKDPIVIEAETTPSSVTVSIYGAEKVRDVTATTPEVIDRRPDGFTVRIYRVIEKDGEVIAKEPFITSYNDLVEASPTPSPSEE